MILSVRDVKRLLAAGIKAEYERTHDPRLEDAETVCAASLTEICRQAAAPAWNAGAKHVLDHPEIAVMYDPADASTNPWKKAGEMPDDSHVESCFVVEKPDDHSHRSPEYDTYKELDEALSSVVPTGTVDRETLYAISCLQQLKTTLGLQDRKEHGR